MSNYASVKATINANVKQNNNQEITGVILNSVLNEMVTALGDGYQFKGVATTSTNPGSPDAKVFYVATPGTYTYFGNQTIPAASTGFFRWDTTWHLETISTGVADGSITQAKLSSTLATALLATGYKFMGVAAENTNPGTPSQYVFYLSPSGTFTNFGGAVIPGNSIGVLYYDSAWHSATISLEGFIPDIISEVSESLKTEDNGEIQESDYPKTGLIFQANGKWGATNKTDSILIPLLTGYTYTLTFSNGLGGYSVVLDSQAVSGATINLAPGYSGEIHTVKDDVATLQGTTGQYLYVRADPVSNGRVFPDITYHADRSAFILRTEIDAEPTEGSTGVVESGSLYTILSQMSSFLEEIKDVLPVGTSYPPGRQDVDLSTVSFYNRTPGGSSNNARVISSTIPVPEYATGCHIKMAEGYLAILYYLREGGSWDSSVQDSGAFAQNADLTAPTYTTGGVWAYFRNSEGTNITPSEIAAAISELYFDVPDAFLLPVASEKMARKSISILFIGNSLTQDAVSYVPYLLRTLYPDIDFKFYMWYNAGYTLGQQYTDFVNDAACDIFSTAVNSESWVNANNSVKMSQVLATYNFDIVCLQEYFNYKASFTDADLVDFNNCVSYIRSHYEGEFKVVSLFHAPLRSSATAVFNLTKAGNQLILQKTIAESLLSPGVAVYRALSTDLDSLGDRGHLSPDGTHTQEGLPCLLQAFVVFKWIMRQLSLPISVANCPVRMTTAIYNTLNVPGANLGTGVIEGTDAQNLLAQDVAILADKEGEGIEMTAFQAIGT